MKGVGYYKNPGAKGTVWTSEPEHDRPAPKGKFDMTSELSQKDLEFLYSKGYHDLVGKFPDKPKEEKKPKSTDKPKD